MSISRDNQLVIAVDGSDNSRRAVAYVGDLVGDLPGFTVVLLHVIHAPEADFFEAPEARMQWIRSGRRKVAGWLAEYRQMLIDRGMAPDRVTLHIVERDGPSLARLILTETVSLKVRTIVVGRQGLSRKEEFLFGSVSKQIVSHARNCTVWVVH